MATLLFNGPDHLCGAHAPDPWGAAIRAAVPRRRRQPDPAPRFVPDTVEQRPLERIPTHP